MSSFSNETQFVLMRTDQLQDMVRQSVYEAVSTALREVKNSPTKLYTRKDVMDIFRISQPTLDNWIKQGKFRAIHEGGRTLFNPDEIDAMCGKLGMAS